MVVALIRALYRIERQAKELGLDPAGRVALRQKEAAPILSKLREIIGAIKARALPRSKLGEAATYAMGQWDAMVRYLDVGEAEVDNNSVENTIRSFVVGRNNWTFFGNAEGGALRATIFYTLICSCKRIGIEPFAYLRDVLDRISTHPAAGIRELTPRGWKESLERHTAAAAMTAG